MTEECILAPPPTRVIAVETIDVPQAKRDPAIIDKIHADLLRYPANFSSSQDSPEANRKRRRRIG
jgi:hypothetical protein